jgi:flavin-dependent dehydrogenase
VWFHSENLDRQAAYRSRRILGFLLRAPRLLEALERLARRVGVERLRLKDPPRVNLEERQVVLSGGREARAGLLLLAQGSPSEAAESLSLAIRPVGAPALTVFGLDIPLPRGGSRPPGDLHVVAFTRAGRLGMFFQAGKVLHARIVSPPGVPAGGEDLAGLLQHLQRSGLLPRRVPAMRTSAAVWHPPGGAALESEVLVAKRTLLVGTAGGFASAMTGQTLDPSIRSALVAADVAHRALASPHLQETLGDFKSQWRPTLADRIRPPGTSLQMLLPMVLANTAITVKFARALLYGERL